MEVDTLNFTNLDTVERHLQRIEHFDEKNKLIKTEAFNKKIGKRSSTEFKYDDIGNLSQSWTEFFGIKRPDSYTEYQYFHDEKYLIRKSSNFASIQLGKTVQKSDIHITRLNDWNEIVQTEHLDENRKIITQSKKTYNESFQLVSIENYQKDSLILRMVNYYDSKGRKIKTEAVDGEDELQYLYNYYWINEDDYEYKNIDEKGEIENHYKIKIVRDEKGNIIKDYMFDLISNRTILIEYEIEYYTNKKY